MSEREITNRLSYYICCVSNFAERFGISKQQAFRYLSQFNGMSFLYKYYEGEHTLSIEDSVDDMARICQRNGGALYD